VEESLLLATECKWVHDIRQTELHTAELLVSEYSSFDFETVIEKLKRYESPVIYQTPAKLIEKGGNSLCYEIHKLTYSI
jgi:predicted transcriptional regulator